MSKYSIDQLQSRDLDLYHDICHSNSVIPHLTHITQRQIELLISMRDIVAPYTPYVPHTKIRTETRLWKIIGKTKQGGHLTQAFSRTFFLGEK